MRNQRAGQATFIPLDTIQVKAVPEKYRNFAKGARLAIDCIEYEPAVERAMQHACSSSLICDTMEVARHICYERGQEVKGGLIQLEKSLRLAVTLEGTVIHKSGLITGGQGSSGSHKFDDRDVQGSLRASVLELTAGLQRLRDNLLQQLQDLSKSKPREKADEGLLESLARLDAESTIVTDDLVRNGMPAGSCANPLRMLLVFGSSAYAPSSTRWNLTSRRCRPSDSAELELFPLQMKGLPD
jgi:structural maintenance of chromosome 1